MACDSFLVQFLYKYKKYIKRIDVVMLCLYSLKSIEPNIAINLSKNMFGHAEVSRSKTVLCVFVFPKYIVRNSSMGSITLHIAM